MSLSNLIQIKQIPRNFVQEGIRLKSGGMDTQALIEHLLHVGTPLQNLKNPTSSKIFGRAKLDENDIEAMTSAGLNTDLISKFEGHPQYITLGAAAIWLNDISDLTSFPILRVFIRPRSYFRQRDSWGNSRAWWDYMFERMDLNFGKAVVPGGIKWKQSQWYWGLTVDTNFLKDMGVMEK